jgi:hypothetical protein
MPQSFAKLVPAGALAAAAMITSAVVAPAAAAQCGPRSALLEHLSKQFKEEPRALGLVGSAGVLEIYVSSHGSWTLLITSPGGTACIMAAGESWEELPKLASGPAA